jgi:hypothetical protein
MPSLRRNRRLKPTPLPDAFKPEEIEGAAAYLSSVDNALEHLSSKQREEHRAAQASVGRARRAAAAEAPFLRIS